MQSAKELLEVVGEDTYLANGILRFIDGKECFIPEGMTVFSRKYLLGLKKACKKAKFISHFVKDLEELASFDKIVLTVGPQILSFFDLPLNKTIGQCLICECPEPIPISLLGRGHITPTEEPNICLVGSTYEHTSHPDPKKALVLLDQVSQFYPLAKSFKIREICSATRISPKVGYKPLLQQMDPKVWVFTGLGSRGLIYHALFAKDLCSQL
jgi:glycine/D-amino acid oxidase-like deaminating enzyme